MSAFWHAFPLQARYNKRSTAWMSCRCHPRYSLITPTTPWKTARKWKKWPAQNHERHLLLHPKTNMRCGLIRSVARNAATWSPESCSAVRFAVTPRGCGIRTRVSSLLRCSSVSFCSSCSRFLPLATGPTAFLSRKMQRPDRPIETGANRTVPHRSPLE